MRRAIASLTQLFRKMTFDIKDLTPQLKQQLGQPTRMRENPAFKKIDSPEFQSIFTDELHVLIDIFKSNNYELRIAGGAVRDILMNIPPKDIDFATTATPDEMKDMFNKANVRLINAKGERHGTITPRINDKVNFEVTTLRIDLCTDGRHAVVEFTTDWQLDANRRDLTINSMFLGFDGTLYDYFYGYDDLMDRRIRFVGNAEVRIKEDYLRILRYFRFYGRIANEPSKHDPITLLAIKQNIDGLERISGERIWSELQKIVVGNFNTGLVLEMMNCGLAPYCGLPEEPNVQEFTRLSESLRNFPEPHMPILYLIGLLHTYEDATHLNNRLKLSRTERDLAFFITQQRDKVDENYTCLRDYQKLCLCTSRIFVENLLKYCNKIDEYNELMSWQVPKFPVNGFLLKQRGYKSNAKMGEILTNLKIIWADNDFNVTVDELLNEHLPEVLEKLESPNSSPSPPKKYFKSDS